MHKADGGISLIPSECPRENAEYALTAYSFDQPTNPGLDGHVQVSQILVSLRDLYCLNTQRPGIVGLRRVPCEVHFTGTFSYAHGRVCIRVLTSAELYAITTFRLLSKKQKQSPGDYEMSS